MNRKNKLIFSYLSYKDANASAITVNVNGEKEIFSREELETMLAENESRQKMYAEIYLAKQTIISGLNPITNLKSSAAVAINNDQVPSIVSSSGGLVSIFRPDESSLKQIGKVF